jgi:hypothetical protein
MNRYLVRFPHCTPIKVLATDEQDARRCFTDPETIESVELVERNPVPHDLSSGCLLYLYYRLRIMT